MALFPNDFYNNKIDNVKETEIPLLKDYAIDLETGAIILNDLEQATIVSGLDAVIAQAYRKIHTDKNRYIIYSSSYGSEFKNLIGKGKSYGDTYAYQMLVDCLVDNKYVTGISNFYTDLEQGKYSINFTLNSIYGDYSDSFYVDLD
nr:MAG TPA: Protein of unknown function (DUF2634) [Caudoviricetes sp.]